MPLLHSRPTAASTTIVLVAAALLGIGVVMVMSADASLARCTVDAELLTPATLRHMFFNALGLSVLLIAALSSFDLWRWRKGLIGQPALWLLLAALLALALVLVPGIGVERKGARRWLAIGEFGFQPSELAKVALIVFVAAAGGALGQRLRKFWSGLLPMLLVVGLVAGLVGIEDFGTAALLLAVGVCMLLFAGARWWQLGLLSLPALAGMAYLIIDRPYRVQRLMVFLDPFADPQGTGYHQVQSLVTIASGGWWGRGLGAGIQKYGYLPEARSDFIFALICEELGIIGGIGVIGLFAVLLWQARKAITRSESDFGRLLTFGAAMVVGLQAAMNIAVVTVSVPTKGIGLPLVSAGGSSVIFLSFLIGLMANVARRRTVPRPAAQPAPQPVVAQSPAIISRSLPLRAVPTPQVVWPRTSPVPNA